MTENYCDSITGQDHKPRPCFSTEFRCPSHNCIDATKVCDGTADCGTYMNGTKDIADEIACCKSWISSVYE